MARLTYATFALVAIFAGPAGAYGPTAADWLDYSGDSSATCPSCPVGVRINAVHGRSRPDLGSASAVTNDVWAVGDNGLIMHYNGTNWSSVASPTAVDLHDVYINQDGTGWAVGERGTILYLNGSGTWTCGAPGQCPASCAANQGGNVMSCSTLFDIFPGDPYGNSTTLFIVGQAGCDPPDATYGPGLPTVLFWNGSAWQKLTNAVGTCTGGQQVSRPGPCTKYGLDTVGFPWPAYTCGDAVNYTGVMNDYAEAVVFESGYWRGNLYYDAFSENFGHGAVFATTCVSPYPSYFKSALIGNYMMAVGGSDNCVGSFPGFTSTYNFFRYIPASAQFVPIDTGMGAGDYGTLRGMDFLPLWGFGLSVGQGSGAYNVVGNDAYFALINYPDPTRRPRPDDPGSPNVITYYQEPATEPEWNRLNGVFITEFNEAWAVGDNGLLLHWVGPTPPEAALDVSFSMTRIGMAVTVYMSATNTGGSTLTGINVSSLARSPSNPSGANWVMGPIPSAPASIPPGGPVFFAWTYSLTGFDDGSGNVRFTGTITGIDNIHSANVVWGSGFVDAAVPLTTTMWFVAARGCTGGSSIQVVIKVTNNLAGMNVSNLVPSTTLWTSAPVTLVTSPPTYAGPLGPGASQTFTWNYTTNSAFPITFEGGLYSANIDPTSETVWATGRGTVAGATVRPLSATMFVTSSDLGPGIFGFDVRLDVMNNDPVSNVDNISPWITWPVYSSTLMSGPTPAFWPSLGPGAGTSFAWTFTATGTLPMTFRGGADGTHVNTALAVCATAWKGVASVPPQLSGSLTALPFQTGPNSYQITVDLTVTNTGGPTTTIFTAAQELIFQGSSGRNRLSGPELVACPAFCPPPGATGYWGGLSTGESVTFRWTYTVTGSLPMNVQGTVYAKYASTGLGTSLTVVAPTRPLVTGWLTSSMSIGYESQQVGLSNRWLLTVVMTVTNTAGCVPFGCDATGLDPANSLTVNPPGRAWLVSGPVPAGEPGPVGEGGSASFTWTYSSTGTVDLAFTGYVSAILNGTLFGSVPTMTSASADVSLVDEEGEGGLSVSRNLFYSRTWPLDITFSLKEDYHATLRIYNSVGQRVRTLCDQQVPRRVDMLFRWDGKNDDGYRVASGVYFIRLESKRLNKTARVALIK